MMLPVYRKGAELGTVAQRRAAWLGNTSAVIRSADLVQKILLAADLLDDRELMLHVYRRRHQSGQPVYARGQLPTSRRRRKRCSAGWPSTTASRMCAASARAANRGTCR
jgi:hypothetical protein